MPGYYGFPIIQGMEKHIAHYPLSAIKTIVLEKGARAFTKTARRNIKLMELSLKEAIEVVAKLTPHMLYKSMTSYANHRVWQDVYHASCPNGKTAYIKLTLCEGTPVIQFKEK
ncbi:MAG: type II toxin-antitoxin system MqsR family toxin [Zoogloeaceae bacterium]|nr:type II toxin-antitoxin system MqsR family toxin [Zoogloeaceae bacterium]